MSAADRTQRVTARGKRARAGGRPNDHGHPIGRARKNGAGTAAGTQGGGPSPQPASSPSASAWQPFFNAPLSCCRRTAPSSEASGCPAPGPTGLRPFRRFAPTSAKQQHARSAVEAVDAVGGVSQYASTRAAAAGAQQGAAGVGCCKPTQEECRSADKDGLEVGEVVREVNYSRMSITVRPCASAVALEAPEKRAQAAKPNNQTPPAPTPRTVPARVTSSSPQRRDLD